MSATSEHAEIVRPYGDTTGDGMVQLSLHAAGAARQAAPRAPPPSWPTRWAWTRRWSCTPSRWGRTSPSSSSTAGSTTSSTRRKVEVVERDYPLLTPKEVNAPIKRALRRRLVVVGGLHRHRRPHRRHRRDPQHQGLRGGEGPGVLPRAQGGEPRRPGLACPQLVERARDGEGRRRPGLPGRHPARRPPAQHPRDVGGLPRGLPGRPAAAAGRRRPALRRGDGRASSASTGSSAGVRRPARSPRYLVAPRSVTARAEGAHERRTDDGPTARAARRRTAATCRTPTPTTPATSSTAPTASACSATSPPRCASAPTATRACSRRTPTCSSWRPVRAGDVLEVDRRAGPGRHPQPRRSSFARDASWRAARRPPDRPGAAAMLDPPLVATTATGTVVVPARPEGLRSRLTTVHRRSVSTARHAAADGKFSVNFTRTGARLTCAFVRPSQVSEAVDTPGA